ncbi:MAG: 30S ribosomal protein S16, partial [Acidobacteria bacterium]|nr:30S ribosomal protein S16 [Acidobacteriota bacterium]
EILGHYNPRTETKDLIVDRERVQYWISKGAQPSATVERLLGKTAASPAQTAET